MESSIPFKACSNDNTLHYTSHPKVSTISSYSTLRTKSLILGHLGGPSRYKLEHHLILYLRKTLAFLPSVLSCLLLLSLLRPCHVGETFFGDKLSDLLGLLIFPVSPLQCFLSLRYGSCSIDNSLELGYMSPQPYSKNYRQQRDAENQRNSLIQGRVHQLVVHYQMVNLENTHTQVIVCRLGRSYLRIDMNLIHICLCNNNEKEAINLKEIKKRYMGGLGGKKGKGEMIIL